ncbi:MFS transporter [Actinomadura rugatobispora]|uniref:MFS transporter n=1 Tax=Actinomadura rugatobispora TaxID=1994 RepID=A0ABW1A689_9ACTN|nr:MFS transporter [Actinomadura rugatobispora]
MTHDVDTVKEASAERSAALGLLAICAAQFLVSLDLSIASIAVPHMSAELGLARDSSGWVLSAFAPAFASMLLLGGRVADLYGRKRVFVTSLLVLGTASLLAGAAWSPATLITGRVLQGLAAGFIAPSALGLLTATIPEGPQRERALGIYGAVLSAGFVSGMIGGGLLTEFLTWRWTMYINVPVVLAAVALTVRHLPESRVSGGGRLDVPGGLLSAGAMVCVVYALEEAGAGTAWASTALILAAGVGLMLAFVRAERRTPSPILPMSLFRIGAVGGANLVGLVMVAAYGGMLIILTLYLQEVLGYGALPAGLVFAVSGAIAIITSTFTGKLLQRRRLDHVLLFGIVVAALGLLSLIFLPERGGLWLVIGGTSVNALGHIIVLVVVSIAANNGVPADHKSVAGAVLNTAQQLGIALGVALLTSLAAAVAEAQPEPDSAAALVTGWRWALALSAALALSTVPLTLALRKRLRM